MGGCRGVPPGDGSASSQGAAGGKGGSFPKRIHGTNGSPGAAGTEQGTPGIGGTRGSFNGLRWQPTGFGEDGQRGKAGSGGGGGGGGLNYGFRGGGSGGGGGYGGCGGEPGQGGSPGGSSFGMLVVNSAGLYITQTTFEGGDGGAGGSGGNGGLGGYGGFGGSHETRACDVVNSGIPAFPYQVLDCEEHHWYSGDGGDGAAGAAGGPGGGGAGGDSIGIYCHNSVVAIDPSTEITEGTAGKGGEGGRYVTRTQDEDIPQPHENGEDGIAAKTFGCN